ncbi:MAG: sugar ABC transporter ATP-binding protein [Chloroflexi bacterium]|nr:MAG: sugar ABC transporter ATP-binding protein [Chloroflexota bacterium]
MSEKKGYLVEMRRISKNFGHVQALRQVDFTVGYAEVVGLLGDNGAGKSTLIKILTGLYPPDEGEIYFEGKRVHFSSPRQARDMGIETVYQDLALVELMSIARNFFLGREPIRQIGPFKFMDQRLMNTVTRDVLSEIGIKIRSPYESVSILSGGERQSIAIGRAIHFGVKLLILDEPTSALSIKEVRKVLNYVEEAKKRGLSVIFITHNIYHVYPVADRFTILSHGRKIGDFRRDEITPEEISELIVGTVKE